MKEFRWCLYFVQGLGRIEKESERESHENEWRNAIIFGPWCALPLASEFKQFNNSMMNCIL